MLLEGLLMTEDVLDQRHVVLVWDELLILLEQLRMVLAVYKFNFGST
jgi:hypothetical protein